MLHATTAVYVCAARNINLYILLLLTRHGHLARQEGLVHTVHRTVHDASRKETRRRRLSALSELRLGERVQGKRKRRVANLNNSSEKTLIAGVCFVWVARAYVVYKWCV